MRKQKRLPVPSLHKLVTGFTVVLVSHCIIVIFELYAAGKDRTRALGVHASGLTPTV